MAIMVFYLVNATAQRRVGCSESQYVQAFKFHKSVHSLALRLLNGRQNKKSAGSPRSFGKLRLPPGLFRLGRVCLLFLDLLHVFGLDRFDLRAFLHLFK